MTITGTVTDSKTGETLPLANVYVSNDKGKVCPCNIGTAADINGHYTLDVSRVTLDTFHLSASYTGYETQTKAANPGQIDFSLKPGTTLPEVIIKGTMIWPRVLIAALALAAIYALYKVFSK